MQLAWHPYWMEAQEGSYSTWKNECKTHTLSCVVCNYKIKDASAAVFFTAWLFGLGISGASDRHSGLRRWFPCHGRLLRCDESPIWVWGPGLCHIHRRPLWIHMVSFHFSFSPLFLHLLLHWPVYFKRHFLSFLFVSLVLSFFPTEPQCCRLPSLANISAFLCWYEASSEHLWFISVAIFI